jgi:hypothetical protein
MGIAGSAATAYVARGSTAADRDRGHRRLEPGRHRVCRRERTITIFFSARAAGARRTHLVRVSMVAVETGTAPSRLLDKV